MHSRRYFTMLKDGVTMVTNGSSDSLTVSLQYNSRPFGTLAGVHNRLKRSNLLRYVRFSSFPVPGFRGFGRGHGLSTVLRDGPSSKLLQRLAEIAQRLVSRISVGAVPTQLLQFEPTAAVSILFRRGTGRGSANYIFEDGYGKQENEQSHPGRLHSRYRPGTDEL